MNRFFPLVGLVLFCYFAAACRHADPPPGVAVLDPQHEVTRIAFGSCLKDPKGAAILDQVIAFNPDLFVWLGDNVYIDTNDKSELFKQRYDALGANPRFQKLRAACPNLAVWDDHDYGNDKTGHALPPQAALETAVWRLLKRRPERGVLGSRGHLPGV